MEDELDLDLETEENNREKSRNKGLSEKVIQTAKERDEIKVLADKAETEKQAALKEAAFYKEFNTTASKYSGATEFQDKIREKVLAGYDLEDATISILAKEGKYTPPPAKVEATESPAGGSAATTVKVDTKPIGEMSRDEMRAQLLEAEKRGDIGLT